MAEIYPNFVEDTPQHGTAPIQSKRVSFVGTGLQQSVSLTWDAAFADANYTLHFEIEGITGNVINRYGFTKTATGITVSIGVSSSVTFVLHAVAFHD